MCFRFALFLSGRRELAEDIAAETFVRALTIGDKVRPGSVKAYLLAVARNLFLDWARAQGRMTSISDEDCDPVDPAPDAETATASRLDLETTLDALQRLPEGERAALLMSSYDGLPYEQIAAALGCSVAAVKVRIHRARLRLRSLLPERRTSSCR